MVYEIPFRAEHVFEMDMQKGQEWVKHYLQVEDIRTLENEWATTLMEDGKPLICSGPMLYWSNRALMWSFIGSGINMNNFLKLHFKAKKYLDSLPFNRLEAAVECGFEAGHRWIKLLGFKMEAERMEAYQINGEDCSLYSRIKN